MPEEQARGEPALLASNIAALQHVIRVRNLSAAEGCALSMKSQLEVVI